MLRVYKPDYFRVYRNYHTRGRLELMRGNIEEARKWLEVCRTEGRKYFSDNYRELFWVNVFELEYAIATQSPDAAQRLANAKDNVAHSQNRMRRFFVDELEIRYYNTIGAYETAEEIASSALSRCLKWFGVDHPGSAALHLQLAAALVGRAQPAAAIKALDEVVFQQGPD
jgi:hypothetical protein